MKTKAIEKLEDSFPKSICTCGHSGDGPNSWHDYPPRFQKGHGGCGKCNCRQFTWAEWSEHFKAIKAKGKKAQGDK